MPHRIDASTASLLPPGSSVDHFRILRLLGRGGMGEVYLARDTRLGRKVALKLVLPEALGSPEAAARFLHEARITARFSHPHIVTVYHVGETEHGPYLALEYLEGQTLRERIDEDRPGLRASLRLARAIAEALKEAHAHQVLHRDLKPENIILPRDGRLRVLDFGLAKLGVPDPAVSRAPGPEPPAPDHTMDASTIYLFDPHTREHQLLRGHDSPVSAATFHPEGHTLAVGTHAGALHLWDLRTRTRRALPGHRGAVWRVAISPDGRRLLSVSWDGTARLWDLPSGQERHVLRGHVGRVSDGAFHPDGRQVVTAGDDGALRLWDAAAGRLVRTFAPHGGGLMAATFSPDGRLLATGGADGVVRLLDLATGTIVRELRGHTRTVLVLAFRRDGRQLASGAMDNAVRVWSLPEGSALHLHEHARQSVIGLAWHPGGQLLASGDDDGLLRLWRTDVDPAPPRERRYVSMAYSLAFRPDGRQLAVASHDHLVAVYDVPTGAPRLLLRGHEALVKDVAYRPDGRQLASVSWDGTLRLWDAEGGDALRSIATDAGPLGSVAWAPDGAGLAVATASGLVQLRRADSGALLLALRGATSGLEAVAFAARSPQVAAATNDGKVLVWATSTGRLLHTLVGHAGPVHHVAFGPADDVLYSSGADGTIRRHALPTGSSAVIARLDTAVRTFDLAPDGSRLVVADARGTLHVLGPDGARRATCSAHHGPLQAVRFSPRGDRLATAGDDGGIRLWDATTLRPGWRGPLFLPETTRLLTHLGWIRLGALDRHPRTLTASTRGEPAGTSVSGPRWQAAVIEHGRYAVVSGARTLCLLRHDLWLEHWDRGEDRVVNRLALTGPRDLLALPEGCLVLAGGGARLLSRSGAAAVLHPAATAIGLDGDRVLLAVDRQVRVLDPALREVRRFPVEDGATTLARVGARWAVGYQEGTVELRDPDARRARDRVLRLEGTISTAVLRIVAGPPGTVLLGYANGAVGVWSDETGAPLQRAWLRGSLLHLRFDGRKAYAATDLGDYLVTDLATFRQPYCALMQDLWSQVPVAWAQGRPTPLPPPRGHRCQGR
jgi:WD40 repeat protein